MSSDNSIGGTTVFAVFAILKPQFAWGKVIEKQLGPNYQTRELAETASKLSKVIGANIEIREITKLDPKVVEHERQAKDAAIVAGKQIRVAQRTQRASHTRDLNNIAKAIALTGEESIVNTLEPDDKLAVMAKVAALKSAPLTESKPDVTGAKYRPLNLNGLTQAIGLDSLNELASTYANIYELRADREHLIDTWIPTSFARERVKNLLAQGKQVRMVECSMPQRPDTNIGLAQYASDMRVMKRLLSSYSPLKGSDIGDHALNRNCVRLSMNRIDLEIESAEMHATNGMKSMPDWPIASSSEPSQVRTPKAELSEEQKEKNRLETKRAKVNSITRNDLGYGFSEHFKEKGASCQAPKNYNRGGDKLWDAFPKATYKAQFSRG